MPIRISRLVAWSLVGALPALAAVGCTSTTTLGVSSLEEGEQGTSSGLAVEPRTATIVVGASDESVQSGRRPTLGDVNGDGYDDFLVEALWSDVAGRNYGTRVFLYYGRPDFESRVLTAQADAVFDGQFQHGFLDSGALGDINGDGFADFALSYMNGFELILGGSERLTGTHASYSTGLAWKSYELDADNPVQPPAADGSYSALWGLRGIGDVDGDGADELVATVRRDGSDGLSLSTDYVIAGRRDGWPSGIWETSWSRAQLGDEPEVVQGDKAIAPRTTVAGSGDFDGDGHVDLLVYGYYRMFVFYGSAAGFTGTLTPEQADATITWPSDIAPSNEDTQEDADSKLFEFARGIPFIVGDVDGDGKTELGVPRDTELGLVYGSAERWHGAVELVPDLTLVRSASEGAKRTQWSGLAQPASQARPYAADIAVTVRVLTADLDGDGRRELLLQEEHPAPPGRGVQAPSYVTFQLTAPSQRETGRYELQGTDVKERGATDDVDVYGTSLLLDAGGDFDGDGSTDLLLAVQSSAFNDATVSLRLQPGQISPE
jgi:hypothetical protein